MIPYKKRKLDPNQVVRVYRNLNKSNEAEGIWYSISQRRRNSWLVIAHCQQIMLTNVKFIVGQKGRERVIKTGRKNVHAFAEGYISDSAMGVGPESNLPVIIKYNPWKYRYFMAPNLVVGGAEIGEALAVCLNQNGMSAAYTHRVQHD